MENIDSNKQTMYGMLSTNSFGNKEVFGMSNVFKEFIDNLTYESAMDLLKRAKLYPEYQDIDATKVNNAIKVAIKYVCNLIKESNNFKFNGSACDEEEDYNFYCKKASYYEQALNELNSDEFNYTKLIIIMDLEKAMFDREALSSCESLEDINAYLRKNIVNIVRKETYQNSQKAENGKSSSFKYKK